MEYNAELSKEVAPGGWATWSDKTLNAHFPRLTHTLARHRGYQSEFPQYLGLYYYLTSALAMWDRTFGGNYPNLKYWWRMEPDVLFSSSLSTFVSTVTAQSDADCLLPGPFISQAQMPTYNHWGLNPDAVNGAPPNKRLWSIVVIGRYSRRMMNLLSGSWEAGLVGYEELSVPMMCLQASGCTVGQLGAPGYVDGELTSRPSSLKPFPANPNYANGFYYSSKVQFRPDWTCAEYLAARANGTHELFHPVKDRSCLLQGDQFRRCAQGAELTSAPCETHAHHKAR